MDSGEAKPAPVIVDIDGKQVVVGEVSLVTTEKEVMLNVQLDASTPEGLQMAEMMNRSLINTMSVQSDREGRIRMAPIQDN